MKISQSSALRPKRGHPDINEGPDPQESRALAGPNNNVADTKSEKNGIIHSSGTSVEAKSASDKLVEVMSNSDGSTKEESITTGCLSEISKFESKSDFCHLLSPTIFKRSRPTISIVTGCLVPSPDLSFQPDEHLEVYVSAYENPNHFWIQILGVRSLQLDKLTEEMTRFYSSSSNPVRTTACSVTTAACTSSQVKIY